jgi:hypothetical protein
MAEYFKKDGDEYIKVDDNLLTQADVDSVVESRLERERKKFADYDTLKEKAGKVDTIAKEYEDKLKAEADAKADLVKQLGSAKLETDKVKVIHEFKLSDDLAEFVTGDTVDDMRAKAEKLSKSGGGQKVVIKKDSKPNGGESDSKKIAKSLFSGNSGE